MPARRRQSEVHFLLRHHLRRLRVDQIYAHAGAVILPANPGFYHRPQSVAAVIDFIVARVLDQLGVEHKLIERWGGK